MNINSKKILEVLDKMIAIIHKADPTVQMNKSKGYLLAIDTPKFGRRKKKKKEDVAATTFLEETTIPEENNEDIKGVEVEDE